MNGCPVLSWWQGIRHILGELWVQNAILAGTAIIGLWTLSTSQRQEKRRATVDVLLDTLRDPEFRAARTKVRQLVNAGLNIPRLLSDEGLADRLIILTILNRYEFMAAGLREGAFDTGIYQRMYHSNVLADWRDLHAFIVAYRAKRERPTTFQELEQLVEEWQANPLEVYEKG